MITVLLVSQIQVGRALQKTYEWKSNDEWWANEYQITIIAPDNWQPKTSFEVRVRLTLIFKTEHNITIHEPTTTTWTIQSVSTATRSVKVILSSENFVMDSLNQEQTNELTEVNSYWEKKFSFDIAEKLNRGQTLNTSIVAIIDVEEIFHYFGVHQNKVWNNYDEPMTVSLSKPILSNHELIVIVVAAVILIGGITGFILYKRRVSVKQRTILEYT